MPLPKIDHISFPITIPSSKKKVRIRPYTVKEEKILLAAQAANDEDETVEAVKQVVSNCVLTTDFDVEKAPMFDIEYLFIKIRQFSVSETVELTFTDTQDLNEKGEGRKYDFSVDLNDVEVRFLPEHTNKIQFDGDVGCVMRYPSFDTMKAVRQHLEDSIKEPTRDVAIQALFMIYAESIDMVYDEEKVYKAGTDFTIEEMVDFIDNLQAPMLLKLQDFFNTIPTIFYEIKYNNSKGEPKTIPLTGLSDFFIL